MAYPGTEPAYQTFYSQLDWQIQPEDTFQISSTVRFRLFQPRRMPGSDAE